MVVSKGKGNALESALAKKAVAAAAKRAKAKPPGSGGGGGGGGPNDKLAGKKRPREDSQPKAPPKPMTRFGSS